MLHSTFTACSVPIPDYVFQAVAVLLSTTAAWVALRTRSISEVVRSTSQSQELVLSQLLGRPTRNVSPQGVRDRKKFSSSRTISTSPGDGSDADRVG